MEEQKKGGKNWNQCSAHQLFATESTETGEERENLLSKWDRSASPRLNKKTSFAIKSETRLRSVFLSIRISVLCFSMPLILFRSSKKNKNWKKACNTRCSQAVTHLSTDRARRSLSSEIERDREHSTWYGRRQKSWQTFPSENSNPFWSVSVSVILKNCIISSRIDDFSQKNPWNSSNKSTLWRKSQGSKENT